MGQMLQQGCIEWMESVLCLRSSAGHVKCESVWQHDQQWRCFKQRVSHLSNQQMLEAHGGSCCGLHTGLVQN